MIDPANKGKSKEWFS